MAPREIHEVASLIPLPDASASLGQTSGFLVQNLITDKVKSRSHKPFEKIYFSAPEDANNMSLIIFP